MMHNLTNFTNASDGIQVESQTNTFSSDCRTQTHDSLANYGVIYSSGIT